LIFAEGVRAAYVEEYVGAEFVKRFFDRGQKYGEIFLVFYAVVEIQVQIEGGLSAG